MDTYADDVGALGAEEADVGVYIPNWINTVLLALDKRDFWCPALFTWIELTCAALSMILKASLMSFSTCLKSSSEASVFFFKTSKATKT